MSWSKYHALDISRVTLHPHNDLVARLHVDDIRQLEYQPPLGLSGGSQELALGRLADEMCIAKKKGKPRILFMGAHPIKLGLSRYLCDMIAHGWFTHVATTGAGLIHDWQLANCDRTDEDVSATLANGQFGFWDKLDHLNELVSVAAAADRGLGEHIGGIIGACRGAEGMPNLLNDKVWADVYQYSIAGMCWRKGVPFTVHVTIGTDILAMYPSYQGESWGKSSYRDFRILLSAVTKSDNGVFINMGSAVTGPEVFLKAMSVAANIGRLPELTTAVFDRYPLPDDWRDREFTRDDAEYYWRPLKTILKRTVAANPLTAHYVCGDFAQTVPRLWTLLQPEEKPV